MSQGMIPRVGDKGTYILKDPWVLDQKTEYTCVAIRAYSELVKNNLDVYNHFYKVKGLSEEDYRRDFENQAVMIGLRNNSSGNYVYVPSTYILSTPNGNGYVYARRFISIDLGPLPNNTNTETLREDIKDLVLAKFGVEAALKEVQLPILEVVNPNNHEALERARRGKISEKGTYSAKLLESNKVIEALKAENKQLTDKLIELGVISI